MMSIYRRFAAKNLPSFVTTNTRERSPIFVPPAACELLIRTIDEVRAENSFLLLALTIMPDHLHLILVPSVEPLGRIIQLIKGRFAYAYNQGAGRRGAVWQSRYHERTLRSERALLRAIEYVHQNPVTAGLVVDVGDYPWSSANGRCQADLLDYLA